MIRADVAAAIAALSAFAASGCACESTIGLNGGEDADADAIEGQGEWDPPIEDMGETGWRDSTVPWCSGAPASLMAFAVWSEPAAAYVMGEYFYYPEHGSCSSDTWDCYGGRVIYRNDGSGWTRFWEPDLTTDSASLNSYGMTGGLEGRILVWGQGYGFEGGCPLMSIAGGTAECVMTSPVNHVFVVSDDLAYGIMGDRLIYWDGSTWGPVPAAYTPYEVSRVWADGTAVFAVGGDGTIMSLEGSDWRIHDTRTLNGFSSVWGFDGSDVWAGTSEGTLHHYDGTTWEQVEWPVPTDPTDECRKYASVHGMWGKDGVLFINTGDGLVTWDGAAFSVLGWWPGTDTEPEPGTEHCDGRLSIMDMWGNSPDEVFFAVKDYAHETPDCGNELLMWWDGSEFHWF